MRCNALQHTKLHCITLRLTVTHAATYSATPTATYKWYTASQWETLRKNATHCNILQYTMQHTLQQHTATHCNALQRTLQHTAAHCSTLHCSTLQHTATHCTTLQYTATNVRRGLHCNTLKNTKTHKSITGLLSYTLIYCFPFKNEPFLQRAFPKEHALINWNTLQHIATKCCNALLCVAARFKQNTQQSTASHTNKLQHTAKQCCSVLLLKSMLYSNAIHCNTMQCTATQLQHSNVV